MRFGAASVAESAKPWVGGRVRFGAAVVAARRLLCGARCPGASEELALFPAAQETVLKQLRSTAPAARQPPVPCAPRRRTRRAPGHPPTALREAAVRLEVD